MFDRLWKQAARILILLIKDNPMMDLSDTPEAAIRKAA